jgi:hypothetical protein
VHLVRWQHGNLLVQPFDILIDVHAEGIHPKHLHLQMELHDGIHWNVGHVQSTLIVMMVSVIGTRTKAGALAGPGRFHVGVSSRLGYTMTRRAHA